MAEQHRRGSRPGQERSPASAGPDEPLAALAAVGGRPGDVGLLGGEGGLEQAADLGLAGRERGTAGALADREEAGQQPSAGLEERADELDVLRPPGGVDGAEAGA